jgi:hypothetical protein
MYTFTLRKRIDDYVYLTSKQPKTYETYLAPKHEPELMPCAWCGNALVPESIGYCSKRCHDNDRKANQE